MKNLFKKPFLAIIVASFLLVGCGQAAPNLPEAEKNLQQYSTESGQLALNLANQINIGEDGSANYEQIALKANEAKEKFTEMKATLEALKVTDTADQTAFNAIVHVSNIARITAKVQELANDAIDAAPGSEELDQIVKQLNGLKTRLESSPAKFEELNQELVEVMANPPEEAAPTDESSETPSEE